MRQALCPATLHVYPGLQLLERKTVDSRSVKSSANTLVPCLTLGESPESFLKLRIPTQLNAVLPRPSAAEVLAPDELATCLTCTTYRALYYS